MKSTKIDGDIQRAVSQLIKRYPVVRNITDEIYAQGGRSLLIGGAVRDMLLGLPFKDIDIEIHGLPLDALQALLSRFGEVDLVGKAFGVLRIRGIDIDWALPRADSAGRKPHVVIDPHMSLKEAFRRRDLTINALGVDLNSCELIDPFQGHKDIEQKVLRSPDPQFFAEDPLRLFRVMQFISRFEMQPDETLNALCKKMDISGVSKERIEQEFKKLLLKSKKPSRGIRWLKDIGRLKDILPEVATTVGVAQEPSWHPEGDVFEHTMQALDAAASAQYKDQDKKLMLMYAVLCHDIGKPYTTKNVEGVLKSPGHAQEGAKLAKQLLKRFTSQNSLISGVQKLVDAHMAPLQFYKQPPSQTAYKRLALRLAPEATLSMLSDLSLADRQGRNPEGNEPLTEASKEVDSFRANAQKADVFERVEKRVLEGRDLRDALEPGPEMGAMVKRAYEIQLEEGIKDKDELRARVLNEKK